MNKEKKKNIREQFPLGRGRGGGMKKKVLSSFVLFKNNLKG